MIFRKTGGGDCACLPILLRPPKIWENFVCVPIVRRVLVSARRGRGLLATKKYMHDAQALNDDGHNACTLCKRCKEHVCRAPLDVPLAA